MINFDFQKTDSFGVFLFIFLRFLIIFSLSLRRRAGFFYLSSLCFLKIFNFPSTRSGRAGPLLSAPAENRQRKAQGSFPPLRIPRPKWGAGRPPLETPKSSLARSPWPNSSPLRGWSFGAVGESHERLRARHDCRTSTASVLGASPPCPLPFPLGDVCPSCAFAGHAHLLGLRPLAPCVPQREKPADHARQRMVPRPKRLLQQCLRKSPGSSCRVSG